MAAADAAREIVVPSGAARLHVREIGEGPPIVVLHGGPDFDHVYLLPELDALADVGRLVAYDQRGRGRSYHGEGPRDVTIASEMADLDRIREWTGSPSVTVLGHSWGGLLAMEYAVRHPERVSRLILVDTAPPSHVDAMAFRRTLDASRTSAETAGLAGLREDPAWLRGGIEADSAYYRIHFRPAVWQPADLERIVARLRVDFTPEAIVAARAIEEALYEETWQRDDYDLFPGLRGLPIPTLVIHGEHDFIPVELARHIATAIPGAELVVVPDCGHFALLERPELVHDAIARFLGRST